MNKKNLILLALIIFSPVLASGQNGTLVGTALFVDAPAKKFIREAAKTVIKLRFKGESKVIKTDFKGDFILSLPVGRYCLLSVTNKDGQTAEISPEQSNCFTIKANADTRFDIMLLDGKTAKINSAVNSTSSPRQTEAKKTKIVEASDNPQTENSYNRRSVIFNKPNAGKNQEVKIALANPCEYWQSKVDMEEPDADFEIDETNAENVLKGIDCLLRLEGNKKEGLFSGATGDNVSQTFPNASVEVCALYYVSYLFYQDWKHADAIALVGKDGSINSEESVKKAFESYKLWLQKLKKTGLQKARAIRLDPLLNSGIKWY